MAEVCGCAPAPRARIHSVQVARLAERQSGVASRQQLLRCGLSGTVLSKWVAEGRLHRVHPGVYAVGHPVLGIRARLVAALLYTGPGAVLSHQTAAWHWRLIDVEPRRIHVSTANHTRSLTEIRVHRPRSIDSATHDGLAVTTVPRTLLDLAACLRFSLLRRALAEADHLNLLDPVGVRAQLGRGRAGASALRHALSLHCPELAQTRSVLEARFLALVQEAGLRTPEVNSPLQGFLVDALWRAERGVVEVDGHESHAKPAALERDRQRDLELRSGGFDVRRYTWQQVTRDPDAVVADLRAALERGQSAEIADP